MSREEAMKELDGVSKEEMVNKYTKAQLENLFRALYWIEPRNGSSKMDLAWECYDFIASMKRTEDLIKNLY